MKKTQKLKQIFKLLACFVILITTISTQAQVQLGATIFGNAVSPQDDRFGNKLDMNDSGSILAIAATNTNNFFGRINTYEYNSTTNTWTLFGNAINGNQGFHSIGDPKLNAAGNRLMYASAGYDSGGLANAGEVQIFDYNGSTWDQIGSQIVGDASQDNLGGGIDMNSVGDRIVIGIPGKTGNFTDSGVTRVYEYQDTGGGVFDWVQIGSDISGEASNDRSGVSAMNNVGDRIAIGSSNNDGGGTDSGHVRIFEYQDTGGGVFDWVQLGGDIDGEASNDKSGSSIAINALGDRVAIASSENSDGGTDAGHIRIFEYNGSSWVQVGADIDGNTGEAIGNSIEMNDAGTTIVIGSSEGNGNNTSSGIVKIYSFDGTDWTQSSGTINGESTDDSFGQSIAIDANATRVLVGAPLNDTNGSNSGLAQVFTLSNNTFNAGVDNNWSTAGNWSTGVVPGSNEHVVIPNGVNVTLDTQDNTINSISVTNGSSLTINAGQSLTVNGDFIQNGTTTLNSGSSLIVKGASTGNITYNRTLPTNNWYLVSSPFEGETIEDLISNHTFDTGTSGNIGLAPYNNGASGWNYQNNSSTGTIASGSGISAKLASAGDISFTGTMNTEDVLIPTASTDGFNLVGNPYPSYLAANNSAGGTNLLNNLSNAINTLTESTIWIWNSSTSIYETVNHATAATFIAPGQGFFVSAFSFGNFIFTETMQSHQSTDTFLRNVQTNTRPEIELTISNGTQQKKSDIYYITGTTIDWDNGYDSTMFNGGGNDTFSIYTHLVGNSQGQNLSIQSLPDVDFGNMIIPVGINATTGTEITISANGINFPAGIDVYLEDKDNNSFTLLDNSSDFTTTLTNNSNGIGRFYLHTNTSNVLSNDEISLENISIYTSERNNLRLTGIQNGKATVKIYNILGRQVLHDSFQGIGINDISLPNLKAGIYIVQLQTETGKLNKKINIQ